MSLFAAAIPAAPASTACTGAEIDRCPVRSVRVSEVTTVTDGTSLVETSVPASIVTSPGAGVSREKTTSPTAKSCVRRVTPTSATSWSSARPSAVSMNASS